MHDKSDVQIRRSAFRLSYDVIFGKTAHAPVDSQTHARSKFLKYNTVLSIQIYSFVSVVEKILALYVIKMFYYKSM